MIGGFSAVVLSGVKTSQGYGIGSLPLPVDNLTEEPIEKIGDSERQTSRTVGELTMEQATHVSRLTPIRYCANPELYLSEAASEYVPCELYESSESYQVRLGRSYSSFQPFYSHLRNLIVGTALRKSVQYPDSLSSEWESLFKNVDLEGHSLQSFAKTLFTDALDGGCCGIFVEYPEAEQGLTIAQERERAYRPYFVVIPSQDILGWTSEVSPTTLGDETVYGRKLTSLRLKDEVREKDPQDEFNELIYPSVRVYDFDGSTEEVRYRQYVMRGSRYDQRAEDHGTYDAYRLEKTGYLSVKTIPFVPIYGGMREGFMLARPLLLDVARLNLHHWSTSADLSNQLHLSAVPKMVITGVQGGHAEFENAPDKTLILDKPEAKAEWIGAPMAGAEAVMAHLKNLEEAMEKLAAVAMSTKTTNQAESGFSKLLDRAQSDSLLAVLVQGLEESLNTAIDIAAEYWGQDSIEIKLSRDFVPVRLHSQQILSYVELFNAKVISHETFLQMLEVGDVFDGLTDFNVLDEISKVGSKPGNTGLDAVKEIQKEKQKDVGGVNGRQSTTKIEGSRPRQDSEAGVQLKESARVSTPGG